MRRLLFLCAMLLSVGTLVADPPRFSLGLGVTEIDKIQQQGVASVEMVLPPAWRSLRPFVGLHVSQEGDAYLCAGAQYEWPLGKNWWGRFGLGAGYFRYDGGYQLGGPLEFQSLIVVERVWKEGVRAGFTYQHLSHGGVYGNNPGSERLLLTLSFPVE